MADLAAIWTIPLVALLISVITFVASQVSMKHMADGKYVESIEERVKRLEQELLIANTRIRELTTENIELMRQLLLKSG